MSDVSANIEELKRQLSVLRNGASELEAVRKKILLQYQQLGTGWNDEKYRALGVIVSDSNNALRTIEKILLQGQKSLLEIISAAQEYEDTNLTGAGSGSSGYTRHLTSDEINEKWQSGVASIDEQINNYREALMERGVPACAWLDRVLAQHRAAMLQQESLDLSMAGGQISAEDYSPSQFYQSPGDYHSFYDSLAADFMMFCLAGTNPNYNTSTVYRDNCQRCVPTYELRRRGVEAEVHPSNYGSDHLAYYPFDVWDNARVLSTQGSGLDDIRSEMQSWGDGARAQVVVLWDDGFGTNGHTFMAEQRNGETVFFDPQTGSDNVADYFDDVIPNTTQFCRIDNLQTTNYINDCYFERSS